MPNANTPEAHEASNQARALQIPQDPNGATDTPTEVGQDP